MKKHAVMVAALTSVFLGAVGRAEDTMRPNILFCIADDASAESFGPYGCTYIKTPAIDRLAQEGAVFRNAYCNNPKCAPARAALVTGRYSWQLGEACNHWPAFPEEYNFYPHLLRDAGTPRKNLFVEDNLHMTRAGYVIWKNKLRPILMQSELQYERINLLGRNDENCFC